MIPVPFSAESSAKAPISAGKILGKCLCIKRFVDQEASIGSFSAQKVDEKCLTKALFDWYLKPIHF
jgi:hypothetical protein